MEGQEGEKKDNAQGPAPVMQATANGAAVNSAADGQSQGKGEEAVVAMEEAEKPSHNEAAVDVPITMETDIEKEKKSPGAGVGVTNRGYNMDAAVDLHTGSIVFSEKGTLSDTYQWLLAEDGVGAPKPCPGFCYTDLCVAKCYSITLGFALVSLIITVVMTVSSVPKLQAYQYTTGFLATNCSTKEAEFHGHWETCQCNQKKSTYPCVQIYVLHGGQERGNETVKSQLIRSTEEDLITNLQCSFKPRCNCDKEINRGKVVRFINIYNNAKKPFQCFYNPKNHSEVIRLQTLNQSSEWGKMTVPASIFLVCMLVLLLVLILRKNEVWTVAAEEKQVKS